MQSDISRTPGRVNSCQQDLYLLAKGDYPGVEKKNRAKAARLIVTLHNQPGQLASWKDTAKVVLDALLVPGILGSKAGLKSLFLVELGKAPTCTDCAEMQAGYYSGIIERVLDKVEAYREEERPDGCCFLGFKPAPPDHAVQCQLVIGAGA